MWRLPESFWRVCKQATAFVLLVATVTTIAPFSHVVNEAEAAVVTVDATVSTDANRFFFGGSQTVFTTDDVGYKFYVDGTGQCVYSKTTNAGGSWGTPVVVDGQTDCASISVWYDQWTPNDYGTYIHIATMETASAVDRLFYNRLDTTSDTRLLGTTPVQTSASSSQGGTFVQGVNNVTVTKSTGGEVFMAISDGSDSFVVRCSTNCTAASSWTEAGTLFMDLDNDWNLLQPLTNGSVLLINRDISADDIRSRTWNGSSWSASWSVVDVSAVESATYDVSMAAVIDHSSGDVYLAYGADHNDFTTLDHDIRTAKFTSGSWSATTPIFTNRAARGLHTVAIALDTNTSTVYVAYILRTTPGTATTGNVYFATSTSALSTWSTEQGPVNTTAGDLRGLDMNLMSDERIYVTWQDPAPDDIFGETIINLNPVTKVYPVGIPLSSVTASTSDVHLGTTFAVRETVSSRNVTDVVITERGTIAADTAISAIALYYDTDTSAPYNCVGESYSGTEAQYGSTDTNGFSGANGTAAFSDLVSISPTAALCLYPVVTVLDSALDGSTIDISIETPSTNIIVTGGGTVLPAGPVRFSTSTRVINDTMTQTHVHWRNDNGSESAATSATGGIEDTPLAAIQPNSPRRLRVGVSNEGSITSPSTTFRLEYGVAAPTCSTATGWTDVGAVDDAWNMFDSSQLTHGNNTTNIAVPVGGVTDENTTFVVANNGVRDTSSDTVPLSLTSTQFTEYEFSLVASTSASEGTTYCFRLVSDTGSLPVYSHYGEATVAADVSASTLGTVVSSVLAPSTLNYVGAPFVLRENVGSRSVTDITIAESGSVDGALGISNIRLYYDQDTSAPYNCVGEAYSGSESQFGGTDTDGFSASNGTTTFSGSVSITTTSALCLYPVFDVTNAAENGQTIRLSFQNPSTDVVVSSGSVSPSTPVTQNGTTTIAGAVITQTGYHWRTVSGGEATSTSATAGVENTRLTEHPANTPIRLRLGISNEGAATTTGAVYRLEFGPRVTTCDQVGTWQPVDATTDDWDMADSPQLTHGQNTTNIAIANGGVSDGNPTFVSSNAGVRDISGTTSALTIGVTEFVEYEFSITSTAITAVDTTYCFRLARASSGLQVYSQYAELATAPRRDFKVQRGTTVMTSTTTLLTAGVDFTAPASSSRAFARIISTHHTGAGRTTAGGGAQNADDITVHISNSALPSSVRLQRPAAAGGNTRVDWEIVEYIGVDFADNEMIVRQTGTLVLPSASTTATSSVIAGISDDRDVVVFITGIENRDTARNFYYAGQVTSEWSSSTDRVVLRRGAGGAIIAVSYAVVEFTGINWQIQRAEHSYSASGTAETRSIAPVNSLSRTFLHTQKRMGALGNVNNFGHEVWLSSIGAISFRLEAGATTPASHVSVAWVIENQQTSNGAMKVQRYVNTTGAGTEPVTVPITLFTPVASMNNTSLSANSRVVGANTTFPLVFAGTQLLSTTSYEIWRSEASGLLTFRTEVIEWPINGLAVRQNYYRFYDDNGTTTPSDPWPPGPNDLGENTPLTTLDEPLGENETIRLRMSLRVANANLAASLYDFKLQYGLRATSCAAIVSWEDVGAIGSATAWRGHNGSSTNNQVLSGDPSTAGDLLLSVSDVAGHYVEENPSPANPYLVTPNEDVEYDWLIEHNGAISRSVYCFRMVRSDGTPLDGYLNYPQLRTAGYTPTVTSWRFYDDVSVETPTVPLSSENVTPIEIQNQDTIALRITVDEQKNVTGQNVKFSVQYDEDPTFSSPRPVVATSSCTATSTWCYAEAAVLDNATVTTAVLSASDSCSGGVGVGCGTHNTSPVFVTGRTQVAGSAAEFAFYLRHAAARAGAVYYFRLYEVFEDVPVPVAASSTAPSVVAETPKLNLTVSGLPAGTSTAGVTTTASTTPTTITFGSLPLDTDVIAAHRLTVTTNATEGYRVYSYARQPLLNTYGTAIAPVSGTNQSPTAWLTGCSLLAAGCVGYHTTDATLSGINATRFAATDSYAGLSTSTAEIMYSPIPTNDTHDMLYRVRVRALQPAGLYTTEIVYIATPVY